MLTYPQGITSIDQIAAVVPNLDQAMEQYWTRFSIGPWEVHAFGPDRVHDMTFHGHKQGYVMRLGLTRVGATMYELIEPMQGPSIYEEFLSLHSCGGLHHLGYLVQDLDKAIEAMAVQGYLMLQSGRDTGVNGDGGYAYFDTESAVGFILEAMVLPTKMWKPEKIYPSVATAFR